MKKPTVFISYAHADSEFVDDLADRLKSSGVDVWIDKWKIRIGDSITQKINDGIGESDFLLVVLSNASVKSKWVREELNAATVKNIEQEKHAFILPVLKEDCEIPSLLQHRKYANFKDDPEQAFQDVLEVVQPSKPFEPELIKIPAGEFLMGSDPKRDKDARDDELPLHRVYTSEFYISKFPVTNAQYKTFVEATYVGAPEHFSEGEVSPAKENHPVVNVPWKDADAYCCWLTEVTGKPFCLPTEAEWEKAARGTEGRIYPWGDEWDPTKLNSEELGPGDTTPVGQYSPNGDSPYSVADMVGNAWEWTKSWYKPYPYDLADERESREVEKEIPRVLRGGAFNRDKRVRCAYRLKNPGVYLSRVLGFRVVVSPSVSDF